MAEKEKEPKYYWLRLKEDFFRDKEIKKLRKIAGGDTYTIIYLKLQLLSLKDSGKLYFEGLEEDFASEMALELDEDVENIKITLSYLHKCGLIEELDINEFSLPQTIECIGSESRSAPRVRRHRNKVKALQCNGDVTTCNTEKEKELEKKKNKEIDKMTTKKEIDLFFESIWELYPSKKGKASISDARKKVLYSIGFDTIKNCIDRYVKDKEEWRPYKDGSTFFNGGYVDYLDENYSPAESQKQREDVLSKIIREGMENESNGNSEDYEINSISVQKLLQGARRG